MTNQDARKLSSSAQEALRMRVIDAIRRGMKPAEAARTFGVSRTAVYNWRRAVRDWLADNQHRIRAFFLPGYSPELNPDEYLNQDVKSNAVGRRRAKSKEELIDNVELYLRDTQRRPKIVRNYFRAPDVRYAAEE